MLYTNAFSTTVFCCWLALRTLTNPLKVCLIAEFIDSINNR